MTIKPTETTLAYFLWTMFIEDDGVSISEVNERLGMVHRQPHVFMRELLLRKHVVARSGSRKYEITAEGKKWIVANKALVADAVLDRARGRVPSSIFNLAQQPTETTRKKS